MAGIPVTFPARPVRELLRSRASVRATSVADVGTAAGLSERWVFRMFEVEEISWAVADRVACALGHHPVELWPEWFLGCDDDEAA